jgi:hypothetical protein
VQISRVLFAAIRPRDLDFGVYGPTVLAFAQPHLSPRVFGSPSLVGDPSCRFVNREHSAMLTH